LIHYPVPVSQQPAFTGKRSNALEISGKMTEEILSIPVHPWLKEHDVEWIVDRINSFHD